MSEPLTDAELRELERLEKAATPGPWTVDGRGGVYMDGTTQAFEIGGPHDGERWARIARTVAARPSRGEDFHFIVAARNALPRLLSTLAALRRERDELAQIVSDAMPYIPGSSFVAAKIDALPPPLGLDTSRARHAP